MKPRTNLCLQGAKARAFLDEYPRRRKDLRYMYWNEHLGILCEDHKTYFEMNDGRIFAATVIEEESDVTRLSGWPASSFPRVSGFRIWKSEGEVLNFRNRIRSVVPVESGHVLSGITRNRPDFPEAAGDWPALLAQALHIPVCELDFSRNSLLAIDAAKKRLRLTRKKFDATVSGPLLGYIGEVARRHLGGQWQMIRSAKAPDIWEPAICCPNGTLLSWFLPFWDMVNDEYPNFSAETIYRLIT